MYKGDGDQTAYVAAFMTGFLKNMSSYVDKSSKKTVVVFVYDENDYESPKNQVGASMLRKVPWHCACEQTKSASCARQVCASLWAYSSG